MTLLRRRAPRRSCCLHGDNGCEIQGEAGVRSREFDKKTWVVELPDEIDLSDDVARYARIPGASL